MFRVFILYFVILSNVFMLNTATFMYFIHVNVYPGHLLCEYTKYDYHKNKNKVMYVQATSIHFNISITVKCGFTDHGSNEQQLNEMRLSEQRLKGPRLIGMRLNAMASV